MGGEAHRAPVPGLRLGAVRGAAAQPAADGAAAPPPVHHLPPATGELVGLIQRVEELTLS